MHINSMIQITDCCSDENREHFTDKLHLSKFSLDLSNVENCAVSSSKLIRIVCLNGTVDRVSLPAGIVTSFSYL